LSTTLFAGTRGRGSARALALLLVVAAPGCGGRVKLESIDPAGGTAAGADVVTLGGHGFEDGMTVEIGGRAATVLAAGPDALRVRTPPGVAGDADVRVVAAGGDETLFPGAFHYAPLDARFDDASPAALPAGADVSGRGALALDLDADGDLDVVQAVRGAAPRVLVNAGGGVFEDWTVMWMPASTADTITLAAGDVDGDGLVDLMAANLGPDGEPNRLYRRRGPGLTPFFEDVSDATMPASAAGSTDVRLADLDADGDLDALFADWHAGADGAPRGVSALFNDGTGAFAAEDGAVPALDAPVFGLAPADFDADGDLDVFASVDGGPPVLLLNDGLGALSVAPPGRVPSLSWNGKLPAAGDVDGDGDPDVYEPDAGGPDHLLLNDGAGRLSDFSIELLPADPSHTEHAVLADLDLDGDLDVVLAKFGDAPDALYLNDGSGRMFDYSARLGAAGGTTTAVLVEDLDSDGAPDVFLSASSGAARLLLQEAPPRLGGGAWVVHPDGTEDGR